MIQLSKALLLAAIIAQTAFASSVSEFGAKGDGTTDDTGAFQAALDAAGKSGGETVSVPPGNYLIKGHLAIPRNVTLGGTFHGPPSLADQFDRLKGAGPYVGSVLLAVEGKGNAEGPPFISLDSDSTLKGIAVFYPEQSKDAPTPYPWTIRGHGDNNSILDVLLVNPWRGVDFPRGQRHLIRGLYGQAIDTGISVDNCFDVGRIEDGVLPVGV